MFAMASRQCLRKAQSADVGNVSGFWITTPGVELFWLWECRAVLSSCFPEVDNRLLFSPQLTVVSHSGVSPWASATGTASGKTWAIRRGALALRAAGGGT